jgi:hypothetical protein
MNSGKEWVCLLLVMIHATVCSLVLLEILTPIEKNGNQMIAADMVVRSVHFYHYSPLLASLFNA